MKLLIIDELPNLRGLIHAINEAPAKPIRVYASALNESISAAEGEWVRVAPYGKFPVSVTVDGVRRTVTQNMDREAADAMVSAFNSLATQAATLWRGLPIFEGHADDPQWRKENPSVRKAAVGRVKELQARDDGLWCRPAFNEAGNGLVRGDAPAYTAHSPHWGLLPLDGKAGTNTRPVQLYSLALTNNPNIPGNLLGLNEDDEFSAEQKTITPMNPLLIKLLAALGQTVTAETPAEALSTALQAGIDKLGTVTSAAAEKPTLENKLATASNEATALKTTLKEERAARSGVVVDVAVTSGRITEAKRSEWINALNEAPDFNAKATELNKLTPAINTQNKIGDVGSRKAEAAAQATQITAINEAVDSYIKTNGLDPRKDYDRAFSAVQGAKPELFKNTSATV